MVQEIKQTSMQNAWLNMGINKKCLEKSYKKYCRYIVVNHRDRVMNTAVEELTRAITEIFDITPSTKHDINDVAGITLSINSKVVRNKEGYIITLYENEISVLGGSSQGVLYGVFKLIHEMIRGRALPKKSIIDNPTNPIRMINHWDNVDGDIERGYAGRSIFFKDGKIMKCSSRTKDYARLLASIGINAITINNVNVHFQETKFITEAYLSDIENLAKVFSAYGISLYLSINFAAPIELGGLTHADPLSEDVRMWWRETVQKVYTYIPNLGGFLVKADSENRPGPFTYGRTQADGANMLAEALEPFGGKVIWRCFVYDCHLDWRDRTKDRAKAAYDYFKPLDGMFKENAILQIKNGPMDFQVREPLSPLFGAMNGTNQVMEFQITAEYTGQQKHVCFLVPMWKECLEFDTYCNGEGSYVKNIVSGKMSKRPTGGIAGVVNVGDSLCWTGNPLAQANLYGFGRLAWNPELSAKEIATEWVELTLGNDEEVVNAVLPILLTSRQVYENYTVPLGIGWMVTPHYHYGPSIEGYEYSQWGTYHYADFKGIGVDRTAATGTGYTMQYATENAMRYEKLETCPEELLLFFHHVDYTYKLTSGKTLIQHIYDTHFEGVEAVETYKKEWIALEQKIPTDIYEKVLGDFDVQIKDAKEWRDVVNTYFYRRTGISDEKNRKIY